jgi:hypothetical protein
MFANCHMSGQNLATPDVCLTPVPTPAGPVPTPMPYPNMVVLPTDLPPSAALMVLVSGAPAHNMMTLAPMSNGDNPGVNLGVLSGMVMGPCRHMLGSIGVFIMGSPATKMASPVGQNGISMNVPGNTLMPSQVRVMIGR